MSNYLTFTLEKDPNVISVKKPKGDDLMDQMEEKIHQLEVKNHQLEAEQVILREDLKILKNQMEEVYLKTQACGCSFLKNHDDPVETEIIESYKKLMDTSDLEDSVETDQIESPDSDIFNQILGLQNLSSTPIVPFQVQIQNSNDSASYSNLYMDGAEFSGFEKYHTSLPSMVETPILYKPEPIVEDLKEVISVQVNPNQIQAYFAEDEDKENVQPQRPTSLEIPSPKTNDKNFVEKQMRILTAPDFKFDDPWISKELIECQNSLNQIRDVQNEELRVVLLDYELEVGEEEEKPAALFTDTIDYTTPLQRPEVKRARTILRRNLNSSPRPRPTIYQSAEKQGPVPETRSMKKRVSFAASCLDTRTDGGKYRKMMKQSKKSPIKVKLNKRAEKQKPFKCSTCSKKFDNFSRFETHLRVHTYSGEKPYYKCTKCRKSFFLQEHLQIHFKAHSGEKPFACTRCLKRFTRKSTLQTHNLTKHLLVFKFHLCKYCSKYYRSKQGLTKHILNVHNIQKENTIKLFKYTKLE